MRTGKSRGVVVVITVVAEVALAIVTAVDVVTIVAIKEDSWIQSIATISSR